MPKIKTCRASAKRFKKTGTGKLVRNKNIRAISFNKEISEKKKKSEKIYCC